MKDGSPCAASARKILAEAASLSACAGALLLLSVALRTGKSEAQEGRGTAAVPELCGARHGGRGDSHPIDLAAIERGYDEVESAVRRNLKRRIRREIRRPATSAKPGFDSGLPSCRSRSTRRVRLARPLRGAMRGRAVWFFDGKDPDRVRMPSKILSDKDAIIFCVRLTRLEDLGRLRKRLGRKVRLAPGRLAGALGVRCAPSVVEVSEDGKEAVVHESP